MGDLFGIYSGRPAWFSLTRASIDFKCVSYNDLATGRTDPGNSIVRTRGFTLVVNG